MIPLATLPKVIIVVLNWNGLRDTVECLESLSKLEYPDFDVIVVDNGSSDGSPKVIGDQFPEVHMILNPTNLGFAGGNNVGIREAFRRGAELVWLLNNDTIVEPGTLAQLVRTAMISEDIGVISPAIRYYDDKEKIQFCGSYVDISARRIVKTDIYDPTFLRDKIVVLWGTALLVKRSVIERIGYLEEKYFAYHEDEEFSIRLAQHGFRAQIDIEATIYHKNSRSTGSNTAPLQVFLRNRNRYFLWMDQAKGLSKISMFLKIFADSLSDAAFCMEKGLPASSDACIEGIWNGIRNRGGTPRERIPVPKTLKYFIGWMLSMHPYFWVSLLRGDYRNIFSRTVEKLGGQRNR